MKLINPAKVCCQSFDVLKQEHTAPKHKRPSVGARHKSNDTVSRRFNIFSTLKFFISNSKHHQIEL